jgi:poly(3-hydroxybutyrate) depolymerase
MDLGDSKTAYQHHVEATWGADPLEYYGGFRNLQYDPKATFRSSLPTNGTASWNITQAVQTLSDATSANASLSVAYSNVDWDFLKVVYGWAAVQYQAWARGELIVGGNETQHLILHTDAILEYWVDDQHYFGGDYYSYRKAPPVLHLKPGSHRLDLRLARDVRAFGGILEPTIDVVVDVQKATGSLELVKPGILMSDVIDGKLASIIGSVYLRNSGEEDVEVLSIRHSDVSSHVSFAGWTSSAQSLLREDTDIADQDDSETYNDSHLSLTIVAGQTRPIAFNVSLPSDNASSVDYDITYKTVGGTRQNVLHASQILNHVDLYKPHKITYLHPGGMASYAILRPPAKNATCPSGQSKLPVLLQLHGAGLEADNPMVTGALDAVSDICAWVLFPTGVTPWSGDDWHNWGFADVEAAIAAIPNWIANNHWTGYGVDTDRWIVSGHSNGGQGTWYALTHRPDKVLAAAPVSGYTSIQMYVPYHLWQPADPGRTAVVSASLNNYRHEMLMPNAHGIPVQQQHGEVDDNVPAYHSRLLAKQLYRTGVSLGVTGANASYNEVAGKNHWFDGVMTTPVLIDFYYSQAKNKDVLPRTMEHFLIVVGDPGDMGSKNGIRVRQLEDPGRYGKVDARGQIIKTSNIRKLELNTALWRNSVTIDGHELKLADKVATDDSVILAYRADEGWKMDPRTAESAQPERDGRQLGSMTAILRTQGPFIIRHSGSANPSSIALQISRNLHQYFQADSSIVSSSDHISSSCTGNVITLAVGSDLDVSGNNFPIQVGESGITARDYRGREQTYGEEARGAAFLRPLEGERLELVLWGADDEGLRQASRIVPLLTGVGQPDFVIFGESARWKGIEGVLAMGFFDSDWEVTPSSVMESG